MSLSSAMQIRHWLVRDGRARPDPGRRRATSRLPSRPAGGARMSVLELRDVEVEYSRSGRTPVRAVAGASLSVDAGQIVGLVGETGCGKSTLARAAVGLVKPNAGDVLFDGQPVHALGRRARPKRETRLQMVFQNPYGSLNPRRT